MRKLAQFWAGEDVLSLAFGPTELCIPLLEQGRRKRKKQREEDTCDEIFGSGDDWQPDPIYNEDDIVPKINQSELNHLCDQLFSDENTQWTDMPKSEQSDVGRNKPRAVPAAPQPVSQSQSATTTMVAPAITLPIPQRLQRNSPVPAETSWTTRFSRFWPLLWLAVFSSLAGVCFWNSGGSASHQPANYQFASHQAGPSYISKPIRDIQPGDYVLARDEHGRTIARQRVVEKYVRSSDHLRILTFRSSSGVRQTIKTTNEHPFWVVNRQAFVNAAQLKVGDQVTGPNGEIQFLTSRGSKKMDCVHFTRQVGTAW